LKAVITCCADFKDWEITKKMIEKHRGFLFATAAIHPQYIDEIKGSEVRDFMELLKKEARDGDLVAVGEAGLDYHWVKETTSREKQKGMFVEFINLAKDLNLPLVVHTWDATLDTFLILEGQGMAGKKVMLHQFTDHKLLPRIIQNGWSTSVGPGILRNKQMRKLVRDIPIERIMLETDSPWFGEEGQRGTPLNVKKVVAKIAEIKKMAPEEVEKKTDENAISFYGLDLGKVKSGKVKKK
jgi:TatD DNase family protein